MNARLLSKVDIRFLSIFPASSSGPLMHILFQLNQNLLDPLQSMAFWLCIFCSHSLKHLYQEILFLFITKHPSLASQSRQLMSRKIFWNWIGLFNLCLPIPYCSITFDHYFIYNKYFLSIYNVFGQVLGTGDSKINQCFLWSQMFIGKEKTDL